MKQTVTRRMTVTGVSLFALALVASTATAQGGGPCLEPNEVDDTLALQAALDECSGGPSGCTVRLCDGIFHTAPLRVADFRGTLRGEGIGDTIIRALPDLAVNDRADGYWHDDPLQSALPWPYLLQFVEGRGTVRDLTIDVPAPGDGLPVTRGWTELEEVNLELSGAILITGRAPGRFTIRSVEVLADEYLDGVVGTTLLYGVAIRGLLFDDTGDPNGFPVFPVSGRHTIQDCTFTGMLTGINLGELADARVSVRRNRTSAFVALDLFDATRSRVEILENVWGVTSIGINAILNFDGDPSLDNTILIYGNRGVTGSDLGFGLGLSFWDPLILAEPGNSTVIVYGNEIEVGARAEPGASAVSLTGAGRALVAANVLRGGVGVAGVGIDETTGCRVFFNDFGGLETGDAPDVLLGPGTSECLTVVSRRDTVVDQGSGNRVFSFR